VVPFPYRLHEMLSNIESKHDCSVVSWLPDGKHFKVHDPRRFVENVIPSAFKQKSLKSFQRQLHLYGFQRVHDGADKGAYFHEKFRRDDRDLCLSITRTKAPKRSRVSPTIRKNNDFEQKTSPFNSRKNIVHASRMNDDNTSPAPVPNVNMSGVAHTLAIFDGTAPLKQSSFSCEFKSNRPLHERITSSMTPDESNILSKIGQKTSHKSEADDSHQQLEGSIVDTCRWLINAGVPISAFDPVAIGDISRPAFTFPQLVPSAAPSSPISSAVSQHFTNEEKCDGDRTLCNVASRAVEKNESETLTTGATNLILSMGSSHHNSVSFRCPFQDDGSVSFENDPLLPDLLPGENLPAVDDSLWAL